MPTPLNGRGPSASQFWVVFMRNPLSQNYQIWRGNTMEGRVSWGQPRLPSQESRVLGLCNFGGFPIFMPTPLTQNDRIRHGTTYGKGVFLGCQPRHCICTNMSRVLSAIAKFFLDFWKLKTSFWTRSRFCKPYWLGGVTWATGNVGLNVMYRVRNA